MGRKFNIDMYYEQFHILIGVNIMKNKKTAAFIAALLTVSGTVSAFPAVAEVSPAVLISEVCTGNTGANGNLTDLKDSKDKFCDWVELYNPTSADADIGGLYLSDDEAELAKAKIPDGTKIPAGGCLVVYCGKNIEAESTPEKPIALFGLSAKGETVILSDGTSIIDKADAPELADDTVYARIPADGTDFVIANPSPNAVNSEEQLFSAPDAPAFSRDSGMFADSFELELTAADGAEIYYTTDGSTPTENSTRYEGAITIENVTDRPNVLSAMDRSLFTDWYTWEQKRKPSVKVDKAVVIRAAAIKDGQVSGVVTKSYFVGYDDTTYNGVGVMSIVTDSDNLFDKQKGIYLKENAMNRGKEWERPVHIDFIDGGSTVLSQDCGMRIQGGYSRQDYQKSLRFYAREEYGAKKFDYPLFAGLTSRDGEGREINDFDKFVLRNGGNDANYTKFKDQLLQRMSGGLELSTQTGRPVVAFINGEYWGLYTMQEDYSDSYVKDHFDVKKKNVVIISTKYEDNSPKVDEGEDADIELWNEMDSWIRSADLTDPEQYKKFTEMFDVQDLANYLAAEIYITNEDWSVKNWRLWRSREADENNPDYSDCRWRTMFYDTEMGVYLWGNKSENSTNNKLIQIYETGKKGGDTLAVIAYKALQNEKFKEMFRSSMATAADTFSAENYDKQLAEIKDGYYKNLPKYFERFPSGSAMWSADQCIGWMNEFFHGKGTAPSREEYYPTMLRALELLQRYDNADLDILSEEQRKAVDSAHTRALRNATNGGTGIKPQNTSLDALETALNEAFGTEKLPRGDVNGDGAVTVTDISAAAAYVKNIKQLNAEAITRADVNGDGKVNITDVSAIAAHVKNIKPLS